MHTPPLRPQSTHWIRAALLLFCCVAIAGVMTIGDYGQSWDETFRFKGGDSKLAYYQTLLSGETVEPLKDNYPGVFDLPLALAHECFPDFGTRSEKGHVLSLCFGLLGLLAAWRLTARIGGERAGFWALLLLVTTPRYYGHMFFNPKDIPLAAAYLLGVWSLVELFSQLPRPPWRAVLWVGVAAGLAMSARIAGLLILAYFALFVFLYLCCEYMQRFRSKQTIGCSEILKDLGYWAGRGAVSGVVALLLLLIFWPAIHTNPLERVGKTMETVQSYGWGGLVLMDGHFWQASDLPFYYIPYWLLYTIPEAVLILFALSLLFGALALFRYRRSGKWPCASQLWPRLLLVFAVAFPLFYLLWKDPVLYDGMRHFLFVVPPMVCVAALGLEWMLRRSEFSGRPLISVGLQVGVGLAGFVVLLEIVSLHPYQYVYFNQASGGLPAAYMRDETDYWGISHKEAGDWLNEYVDAIDPGGERIFKVHQRYSRWMLQEALDPNRFEMWQPREGADFFVSVTRFNLHTSYPEAELLHIVERQGVPLCFIFKFSNESKIKEN